MRLFAGIMMLFSSAALAQDAKGDETGNELVTGADGVGRFQNIKVKRITPDGLPKRSMEANSYRKIRTPKRLPTPPTKAQLNSLQKMLHGQVHEVIALVTPPRPYRQVPMVYRGHAVWISAHKDQRTPLLISTLDWLGTAQEIYIIPIGKAMPSKSTTAIKKTKYVTLRSVSSRSKDEDLKRIQAQKKHYVRVKLKHKDTSRNLVVLEGYPNAKRPAKGLALFNAKTTPLGYAYGYSPIQHVGLVPTTVMPTMPKEEALQFYVQTTFSGILGAPVVSDKGELVALNAIRHPTKPTITLAVPIGPLIDYTKEHQNIPANPPKTQPKGRPTFKEATR